MLLVLLVLPPPQPDRTMPATITNITRREKNNFLIESSKGRRDHIPPSPVLSAHLRGNITDNSS
ncbi:MAG: hypothetical protein ACXWWM_08795, partial [Candidatus Deferrimicrobiaceae bacterium]